ncbi:TRAP transporter small permease [Variovorax sp. SRS16]|uniref:TRAP transporter small permease n=1 Tax=Variovorax sp. SRS16 TaxID=282217 RepID=UPI003FCE713C
MSAGVERRPAPAGLGADAIDPATPRMLMPLARALHALNRVLMGIGMVALLAASVVLTTSVVSRYFLKASTDWQDEAAVFLLVGATFTCGAFVQSIRGHIGIEAVVGVLPVAANRLRMALVDVFCLAFCAFFAWKSWTLLHEAWVDGQTTSSSWAPPLWIPYGLMSIGMTLLTLQLLVQACASLNRLSGKARAL